MPALCYSTMQAGFGKLGDCAQAKEPLGAFKRSSPFLQSPIFNLYHSEHEMLRYLKRLENRCCLRSLPP